MWITTLKKIEEASDRTPKVYYYFSPTLQNGRKDHLLKANVFSTDFGYCVHVFFTFDTKL